MVAAQSDGEDHLKLCKLPQAAEDGVDTRGRETRAAGQSNLIKLIVQSSACSVSLQGVHAADVEDVQP